MKEGGQEHIITSGATSGVLFSSHFGVASQLLRSGVVVRKAVTYYELLLLPRSLIPCPGTSSMNKKGVFFFCKDLKNYHQVSSLSSWNLLKIGETFWFNWMSFAEALQEQDATQTCWGISLLFCFVFVCILLTFHPLSPPCAVLCLRRRNWEQWACVYFLGTWAEPCTQCQRKWNSEMLWRGQRLSFMVELVRCCELCQELGASCSRCAIHKVA